MAAGDRFDAFGPHSASSALTRTRMNHAHFPLLALSLASTLCAQRVAEVEPNDAVGSAQPLVFGQQVDCNLVAGELDWFTFTVVSTGEVHLTTGGNFAVNSSVDTVVLLYDASGTTRLAWNDGARGVHCDLGVTLTPGVYTALVMGKTATTAGAYSIDLVQYAPTAIDTVEGPEPNGDPANSEIPTAIGNDHTFAGSLSSPTDQDWYAFSLTTDSVVQAYVYDDSTAPQLDNTLIGLRQLQSGVWTSFGTTSTNSTSHRAFNLAHPGYLSPGSYHLAISAGSAAAGTAPQNYVKTGNYAVRTRMIPLPGNATTVESAEPNADVSTTAFMNVGDNATGFCSGSNEEDWFAIIVPYPMTVVLMTESGAVAPAITDTTVKLYDPQGALITSASSGGASGQSHGKLVVQIAAPGVYYAAVAGGVFAATGNYVLRTGGATPILWSAAFQQQPPSTNACVGSNALRPQLNRANSEVAQLGTHFSMRVNNALPFAGIVSMLGFSNTMASGGVPLPLDLGSLGAPTCFLRVDPEQTSFGVADGSGIWFWDLSIPNDRYLGGLVFWAQVACFDAPLNSFGVSVSNEVKVTLGDRGY